MRRSAGSAAAPAAHRTPFATLPLGPNQHRLSGTVSTSAGTVLLEPDDLASLDRAISCSGNSPQGSAKCASFPAPPPNLMLAEADDDEDIGAEGMEDEDEDLEAFLENGTDTLRALGKQRRCPHACEGDVETEKKRRREAAASSSSGQPQGHPLVSVV